MSGLIVLGHDNHISEMIELQESMQRGEIICVGGEDVRKKDFVISADMLNAMCVNPPKEFYEMDKHWTPGISAPMKRKKRK